ncbi:MAG: alpha/beta hydrolase, partial [Kiritimatiellae bacterium]|nr:alpha/beta hydrolase [Kiritimatiellia bacterium]
IVVMAQGRTIAGKPYVYKKVGERELKLYVVNPTDWKSEDKRPAIVFYHGGAFIGGSPSQFNEHAKYLASRGMVVVLVEDRFVSKKKAMEFPIVCIQDARSAMRWVRSHAGELGIDPNRVASGGGSAGGYLAAAVGMMDGNDDPQDDLKVPAKSNAMVLFNPLLDMQQFAPCTGPAAEQSKELSPINNISAGDPPGIIFFGSEDKLGSCVNDFKAKMEKAGTRCEVRIYEGQKHGFFNYGKNENKYYLETLGEVDKFLASLGLLSGPPTLSQSKEDK